MTVGANLPATAKPQLLGDAIPVPLVTGAMRRYVNLDYAASTPPLVDVVAAVNELLPYYSSVHRGAGYKSQVFTAAYEGARTAVEAFFDVPEDDVVIFVRNATDAMNMLAESLPQGSSVVAFASEHHANLLPWNKMGGELTYLPIPSSSAEALDRLDAHLRSTRTDLVAVTGASNVTGELWPVGDMAAMAHAHGSRLVLDAAQLAPHLRVSVRALDVDYMAASGHKMYAPFGAGVLVGRRDWLQGGAPYLRGGGAVDFVTTEEVAWADLPARQEAGSPNVVGAVALAAATETLRAYGMDRVAHEEAELAAYARRHLSAIREVETYSLWGDGAERIGVVTFNMEGFDHSQLAAILSAEHGIGVRHGCFCAHPLMVRLLHVSARRTDEVRQELHEGRRTHIPGAVRMSLGLGSSQGDVDALVEALQSIIANGPQWSYALDSATGDYSPVPDPRPAPRLSSRLSWGSSTYGESS